MSKTLRAAIAAGFATAILAVPTAGAVAAPSNWGQEVKDCNQSSCYPGGTSRGGYVSGGNQAGDGTGYADEIHQFANPGNSSPNNKNFNG